MYLETVAFVGSSLDEAKISPLHAKGDRADRRHLEGAAVCRRARAFFANCRGV